MFFALLLALGWSAANACCLPPQHQTLALDLDSFDTEHPYYMTIGHDDYAKKKGVYVHMWGSDGRVVKHIIKDFGTMNKYEIEMKSNTCKKSTLDESFITNEGCQRNDFQGTQGFRKRGPYTVGLGPSTIETNILFFTKDGVRIAANMAQSQNGCFPIFMTFRSAGETAFPDMTLLYYNSTAKQPDPELLNIPDTCQ